MPDATTEKKTEEAKTPDEERGLIAYRTATNEEIKLSWTIVRDFFLPSASKPVAYAFMGFCRASRLNPFLNECWLQEFDGKAQIIVAKDAFMKRAERSPHYKGYRAGLVLMKTEEAAPEFPGEPDMVPPPFVAIEGTIYPPGYQLMGSWCKVWRNDREDPIKVALPLHEYIGRKRDGTVNRMWTDKEATMIRKCSLAHGHREAFPDEVSGFYFAEEFGGEETRREPKNVTPAKPPGPPGPRIPDAVKPFQQALGWNQGTLEMWWARQKDKAEPAVLEALTAECVKAGKVPPGGADAATVAAETGRGGVSGQAAPPAAGSSAGGGPAGDLRRESPAVGDRGPGAPDSARHEPAAPPDVRRAAVVCVAA